MRDGARGAWPMTLRSTSAELDCGVKILRLGRWFANLPNTPEFNVLVFSFLINLAWELWQVDIAIFLGVGIAVTIIFEALATGMLEHWAYNDAMPPLPVLGTGLLPLLQWLALPPLVLWFVRRQIGAPTSRNGR